MKPRLLASTALIIATAVLSSCGKTEGPVREGLAFKDGIREAYIYAFPMLAAYKAMYEFNVDKANSQYKGPFNHISNELTWPRPRTPPS